VQITITQKNAQGEMELYWKVAPNIALGEPRQLAYKLDTLIINRRIDELGRPLPKVLRLDSFKQMCTNLDMTASGRTNGKLKQAFHANAGAYIIAKLRYTATDGTERTLEAGFTRYSVVFTGERLPDGTKADAVYLVLNEPYWEVLNSAPTRPLDYDYLKALAPAALDRNPQPGQHGLHIGVPKAAQVPGDRWPPAVADRGVGLPDEILDHARDIHLARAGKGKALPQLCG
jgi:hypothetical protein